MEDKRKNLRRHIKAATDWLQQADKSIERNEDLKGDLKLMLAKAELKNAEKHQKLSHSNKILSFVTAAAIAFGVLYFGSSTNEIESENLPSTPVAVSSETDESLTKNLPILQSEESSKSLEEPIQTANAPTAIDEPDYISPLNEESSYSQQEEEIYSTESPRYTEPEPVFEQSTTNIESTFDSSERYESVALEA